MPNVRLKYNNTYGVVPTGLVAGELAINNADGILYIGGTSGNTIKILGTAARQAANSVSITGGSIQNTTVGATSPGTVSASNLQIAGGQTVSGVSTAASLGTSNAALVTSDAVYSYINSHAATLKNIITFTANGTYTKSGSDVRQIRVIVVGGGGGGRGYGESGGAGGFSEQWIDATGITSVSVTIGTGGAGGNYYGFSPAGGTTSFGAYCSATGGSGANNNQDHTGGQGGLGSGGNLNFHGGGGVGHHNCHSSSHHNPGMGGASYFGGAQPGTHYTSPTNSPSDTTYTNGGAPGAGGTGSNFYWNGAGYYDYGFRGKDGICIVYEYR